MIQDNFYNILIQTVTHCHNQMSRSGHNMVDLILHLTYLI